MKKIYEVHEADYDAICADGGFARLLEVDEDGMPIRELECNYTQNDINEVLRRS